jgi:hypothetical protein
MQVHGKTWASAFKILSRTVKSVPLSLDARVTSGVSAEGCRGCRASRSSLCSTNLTLRQHHGRGDRSTRSSRRQLHGARIYLPPVVLVSKPSLPTPCSAPTTCLPAGLRLVILTAGIKAVRFFSSPRERRKALRSSLLAPARACPLHNPKPSTLPQIRVEASSCSKVRGSTARGTSQRPVTQPRYAGI